MIEELGLLLSPDPCLGHLPNARLCLQLSAPCQPRSPDNLVSLGLWCDSSAGVRPAGRAEAFPQPVAFRGLAPAGSKGQGRDSAGPGGGNKKSVRVCCWGERRERDRGTMQSLRDRETHTHAYTRVHTRTHMHTHDAHAHRTEDRDGKRERQVGRARKRVGTSGRDEETAETETQERRGQKSRGRRAGTWVRRGAEAQAQERALACRVTRGEALPLSGLHFPLCKFVAVNSFYEGGSCDPRRGEDLPRVSQPYRALPGSYGPDRSGGVGAMAVRPVPSHRSSRVPATPPSDRSTPGSAGSPDLAARAGAGVGPAREEER